MTTELLAAVATLLDDATTSNIKVVVHHPAAPGQQPQELGHVLVHQQIVAYKPELDRMLAGGQQTLAQRAPLPTVPSGPHQGKQLIEVEVHARVTMAAFMLLMRMLYVPNWLQFNQESWAVLVAALCLTHTKQLPSFTTQLMASATERGADWELFGIISQFGDAILPRELLQLSKQHCENIVPSLIQMDTTLAAAHLRRLLIDVPQPVLKKVFTHPQLTATSGDVLVMALMLWMKHRSNQQQQQQQLQDLATQALEHNWVPLLISRSMKSMVLDRCPWFRPALQQGQLRHGRDGQALAERKPLAQLLELSWHVAQPSSSPSPAALQRQADSRRQLAAYYGRLEDLGPATLPHVVKEAELAVVVTVKELWEVLGSDAQQFTVLGEDIKVLSGWELRLWVHARGGSWFVLLSAQPQVEWQDDCYAELLLPMVRGTITVTVYGNEHQQAFDCTTPGGLPVVQANRLKAWQLAGSAAVPQEADLGSMWTRLSVLQRQRLLDKTKEGRRMFRRVRMGLAMHVMDELRFPSADAACLPAKFKGGEMRVEVRIGSAGIGLET